MTPTPEQNAKRETPRCDAAEAALERWMRAPDGEEGETPPSILDLARTLETELTELRQAADGMRDALDCIANQPDKTATGMRSCARESLARYRALAGEGVNQAG